MDAQAAFIDAIRDSPDDDAHRLVYADWLEEQGQDEPAAFLRAHVGLSRFQSTGDDPFNRPGDLDVMNLLPVLRDALLAPFEPLARDLPNGGEAVGDCHPLSRAYRFSAHRGLIETVSVANQLALTLLTHQPNLCRTVPIRLVALTHGARWLPVGSRPMLAPISAPGLESLLTSGLAEVLEAIDLRHFHLNDTTIVTLIRHTKLVRRLRLRLYIHGGPMPPSASTRRLSEAFGPQLVALPPITEPTFDDEIPF